MLGVCRSAGISSSLDIAFWRRGRSWRHDHLYVVMRSSRTVSNLPGGQRLSMSNETETGTYEGFGSEGPMDDTCAVAVMLSARGCDDFYYV